MFFYDYEAGAPEVKTTSRDANGDDNDEQKKAKAKREADRKERGKLIEELISSEETFLTHLIVLSIVPLSVLNVIVLS